MSEAGLPYWTVAEIKKELEDAECRLQTPRPDRAGALQNIRRALTLIEVS